MGKIIYGSEIALQLKQEMKKEIIQLKDQGKRIPHIVVILIGNDVGSTSYVKGKEKACEEVGIQNTTMRFDDSMSEKTLLELIYTLNDDNTVDGILVQLPLPKHIQSDRILFAIDPRKDVDGFHPNNIGKMMLQQKTLLPCTPKGIMKILETIGYDDLSGLQAIVLGRSNIVGKPIGQLLLNKNATVTMAHSKTKNLEQLTSTCDIVIAAVGVKQLVKRNWLKQDAIVIDVGVNRDENGKLCGDVDLEDCISKVKYITPVPKGVGPMTIVMLLQNTLEAYRNREDIHNGV